MQKRLKYLTVIILLSISLCSCTGSQDPAKAPFRFVVMSDGQGLDNGINSRVINKTMKSIKLLTPQPQFAMLPGDLCIGSNSFVKVKSQLEYFKKTVTDYYPIQFFYPGLGNHEVQFNSGGEKAFRQVFHEFQANFLQGYDNTVYYFDYGDARFFMLNTDYPGEMHVISDWQLNWVKANLSYTKQHHFFFLHEPPFPTLHLPSSGHDYRTEQRDKLWDVIDDANSPLVFCGHEHFYSRKHINPKPPDIRNSADRNIYRPIYQITAGGFGGVLDSRFAATDNIDVPPISQHCYVVVDVKTNSVKVRAYNLDGRLLDSFVQYF